MKIKGVNLDNFANNPDNNDNITDCKVLIPFNDNTNINKSNKTINLDLEKYPPFNKMDKQKHLEICRKGGQVAGQRLKKLRQMQQAAIKTLNQKPTIQEKEYLESLGYECDDIDVATALMFRARYNSIVKGDIKSMEFLRDTSGQAPKQMVQSQNINMNIDYDIEKIEDAFDLINCINQTQNKPK